MDKNVIAAMARWPDVPDVFGWLSLSEQGKWRLHPLGDAEKRYPGEPITSPQILRFIDRNYNGDTHGRWFFQNGPQKVFARLDAAPYILHTHDENEDMSPVLRTHNGLPVCQVKEWWLDDVGKLYAQTEHGPGLIAGRDLAAVLAALHTTQHISLMTFLDQERYPAEPIALKAPGTKKNTASEAQEETFDTVLLHFCAATEIPERLGFVRGPRALGRISS